MVSYIQGEMPPKYTPYGSVKRILHYTQILVSVSVPFIKVFILYTPPTQNELPKSSMDIQSIAFVDATNGANELSVGNFGACFANGCGPHELNYPVLNYIQTNLGLASATLSGTVQNLLVSILSKFTF